MAVRLSAPRRWQTDLENVAQFKYLETTVTVTKFYSGEN
jgi:hypothetical protein